MSEFGTNLDPSMKLAKSDLFSVLIHKVFEYTFTYVLPLIKEYTKHYEKVIIK
jgi:hypothetical protein